MSGSDLSSTSKKGRHIHIHNLSMKSTFRCLKAAEQSIHLGRVSSRCTVGTPKDISTFDQIMEAPLRLSYGRVHIQEHHLHTVKF